MCKICKSTYTMTTEYKHQLILSENSCIQTSVPIYSHNVSDVFIGLGCIHYMCLFQMLMKMKTIYKIKKPTHYFFSYTNFTLYSLEESPCHIYHSVLFSEGL